MEAVAALQQALSRQRAIGLLAAVVATVYLFPRQTVVIDLQEFDTIIVGAGSAGVVVAGRLATCGHRVLLVDAGGDPPYQTLVPGLFQYLPHTELDWNYTNIRNDTIFQCRREGILNLTTGRVLGGGSSINYMFYVRGCPGDYRSWAEAADDSSWGYEGLLPLFIKSERLENKQILNSPYRKYHGTKGFLGVTRQPTSNSVTSKYFESFRELGNDILLDINGERSLGYTKQLLTVAQGVRQSTAYAILAKYKNPNLKVLRETFVTKILFDENNNAIGVRATTRDNKQVTLRARREVILSAGALNTPRLLMLSGIGPKEHLESLNITVRNDLPVGKNLQDHASIFLAFAMEESTEPAPPADPFTFPLPTITGYVALNKSHKCPTYQSTNFLVPAGSPSLLEYFIFNNNFKFNIGQNLHNVIKNKNIMFTTLSLLHPESRGEVLLGGTNPRDPPLINLGYFNVERDLETLVDSAIDFVRILNTSYFKSVNSRLVDLQPAACAGEQFMSRAWWRCYARCMAGSLYHYCGTCALGAALDRRLRVRGAGRLRAADAAVLPRIVGGNLNAPVIAVAEKAADIIIKQYGCSHNNNNMHNCKG